MPHSITLSPALSEADVETFRAGLRGPLVTPDDPDYDTTRAIWNAMIDRRPALIARCAGAADVRHAVTFARDHGLPLSIRGAGHNIAGNALCDDGLLIDCSAMRHVHIDPRRRRADVAAGATLGDFDHEAQAFGLATPLGINSTTGVAGLTLGGGFGWLSRRHGMTIDNLVGADVVTAAGEFLHASEEEHPDLFWALRGGGGNFGVVTRFEFQLHPVGPGVLCGLIVYPFDQADVVLQQYRAFAGEAPEDLAVWVVLRKAPPLPFLPEDVHGREVVVLAVFYAGDPDAGLPLLDPLRAFGTPVGEHLGVMPYAAWQQAFDPLLTPGARNYWKSHNFTRLDDGLLDASVAYTRQLPSPQCEIFIASMGGAAARPAPDATAYPHRDAAFVMNVHARWEASEDDAACIGWARDFFDAAAPYASGGVYVNFLTADEGDRVRKAYGPNYDRLARIKGRYDPDNLFRMNQNITPA